MPVTAEDRAAIGRMFAAVDAIDADIARKRKTLPTRGVIRCPNCGAPLAYVQLTEIKGAGLCRTPVGRELCVDFAPLARVAV